MVNNQNCGIRSSLPLLLSSEPMTELCSAVVVTLRPNRTDCAVDANVRRSGCSTAPVVQDGEHDCPEKNESREKFVEGSVEQIQRQ